MYLDILILANQVTPYRLEISQPSHSQKPLNFTGPNLISNCTYILLTVNECKLNIVNKYKLQMSLMKQVVIAIKGREMVQD